jgi:hypothetical protein
MTANDYWWISLGFGVIVLAAALVLLQVLLGEVRRVEVGAKEVWEMGKRVARNTATTWMLGQTSVALRSLGEEAKLHESLLHRVNTGKKGLN